MEPAATGGASPATPLARFRRGAFRRPRPARLDAARCHVLPARHARADPRARARLTAVRALPEQPRDIVAEHLRRCGSGAGRAEMMLRRFDDARRSTSYPVRRCTTPAPPLAFGGATIPAEQVHTAFSRAQWPVRARVIWTRPARCPERRGHAGARARQRPDGAPRNGRCTATAASASAMSSLHIQS